MKDFQPSQNDISSTEKLLDIIRGENSSQDKSSEAFASPPSKGSRRGFPSPKFISLSKKIIVGVDIGHNELKLTKIARLSEQRCKLIAYRSVPFRPGESAGSPRFPEFLRSAVSDFAGNLRTAELWTIMSSAQADVRHIRIPKVARKQIFNAVYWTVKKEMQFDEKESVLDFEVQGEVTEKGIPKTSVMVYTIPRQDIKAVTDLFARSGLRLKGLTIAPFAIQNFFRAQWFPALDRAVASLYIGSNFSRIDIYSKGNLVLTRGIKTGTNSMVESIMEACNEGNETAVETVGGERFSIPISFEGNRSMDAEEARRVLLSISDKSSLPLGEGSALDLDADRVLDMIHPAMDRLVRQMERTFQHYSGMPGSEPVGKIYISGAITSCTAIIDYIGQQLGIQREIMDPLDPALPVLSDVLPPDSLNERVSYTAALGLGLSDNSHTPNVLFTFTDREKQAEVVRLNRGILAAFFGIMFTLVGFFFWQNHLSAAKASELLQVQSELSQFMPLVDQNKVLLIASKARNQQRLMKQKSRNYLGIAVLSELAGLTPENVRLLSITADFGPMSTEPVPKPVVDPQSKPIVKNVVVDGIVHGDRHMLDSTLARYILKLGCSPLFVNTTLHSSTAESYQGLGEVLRFTLKIGIL